MSNELTLADLLSLFNVIDELLVEFNMRDYGMQAPITVAKKLVEQYGAFMKTTSGTAEEIAQTEQCKRLCALLARLTAYSDVVKKAPAGIGRSGAGKGK